MSEQIEWIRKRLTENRSDAVFGVIMFTFFIWLIVSFMLITADKLQEVIPSWAVIPNVLLNVVGIILSLFGAFGALVCIKEALWGE